MGLFKKIIKLIFNSDYRFDILSSYHFYDNMSDEKYLKKKYKIKMGKDLDLSNPQTYNEKLQWLKLYDHNHQYTVLVDKYKVREYISQKMGEQYLIPMVGAWDSVDEIDFNKLPNQFVIKCNHNSGLGMYICKDKSKLDEKKVKRELKKGLEQNYYLTGREWPYKNVPRKIVCEQYMIDKTHNSLPDYKFYCFDGIVKMVGIYQDRNSATSTTADYFDSEFKWLDFVWGYPHAKKKPEKPNKFEEMIRFAEKLSSGFKEIRVDLYLCNDKIYFGELTFFDGSGFEKIIPESFDVMFGKWINLDMDNNGNNLKNINKGEC